MIEFLKNVIFYQSLNSVYIKKMYNILFVTILSGNYIKTYIDIIILNLKKKVVCLFKTIT